MDGLPRAIIIASFFLASALVASGWMVKPPKHTFRPALGGGGNNQAVWTQDTKTGAICVVGRSEGAWVRSCEEAQ